MCGSAFSLILGTAGIYQIFRHHCYRAVNMSPHCRIPVGRVSNESVRWLPSRVVWPGQWFPAGVFGVRGPAGRPARRGNQLEDLRLRDLHVQREILLVFLTLFGKGLGPIRARICAGMRPNFWISLKKMFNAYFNAYFIRNKLSIS